jgi:hypothetical protein
MFFGFGNVEYARQALEQFAFIRECEWARDGSITPETLVETAAERKHEAEIRKIKSRIYAEEKERCLREFKTEIKRCLSSGEMKCPKNVDMLFSSMLLNGHVAETNPGSLEFREQWDRIAEKMIQERDLRVRQRENETLSISPDTAHITQVKAQSNSITAPRQECESKRSRFRSVPLHEMDWRATGK